MFVFYPFVVNWRMPRLKKKLESDQVFADCHRSSLNSLKFEQLPFVIPIHLRKILYCAVLVFLAALPGIQIIIVVGLSEMMMILLAAQPFEERDLGRQEVANEVIILVFVYHVILISDFVPQSQQEFKHFVSLSMVGFLTLVVLYFLFGIVRPLFYNCHLRWKRFKNI